MSQNHESEWLAQVRQHWAKAEAAKRPKKRNKKSWDLALAEPSEKELEARQDKATDRDWLYIEQRREIYSTVKARLGHRGALRGRGAGAAMAH